MLLAGPDGALLGIAMPLLWLLASPVIEVLSAGGVGVACERSA
jgi:hypothetical protein